MRIMAKTHLNICVDQEVHAFHRKAGNNISQICNTALANFEGIKPEVAQLQEVACQKVAAGTAAIDAAEQAKKANQDRLVAQLKEVGTAYVRQKNDALSSEHIAINRMLKSASQRVEITRKSFDEALKNMAQRQGMTPKTFIDIAIRGGKARIDDIFANRVDRLRQQEENNHARQ